MKVFLTLHACQPVCWGLPQPKYEPFITHNKGTLNLNEDWIIFVNWTLACVNIPLQYF